MCLTPIWIPAKVRYGNGRNIGRYVPCGHCVECLQKRQTEWFVRFFLEDKYFKDVLPGSQTLFTTLTYAEENLPDSRESAFNDVRAFIKKLGRTWNKSSIRYYLASENGTQTGRLHYHMLIFGVLPEDLTLPPQKEIEKLWKKGFSHTEYAGAGAFRYACKYVTKDLDVLKTSESWKPISTCSKRPALGVNFALRTSFMAHYANIPLEKIIENDGLFTIPINGYNYSIPRYIRTKLFSELQLFFMRLKSCSTHGPTDLDREDDLIKRRTINNVYGFKKLKNKLKYEELS